MNRDGDEYRTALCECPNAEKLAPATMRNMADLCWSAAVDLRSEVAKAEKTRNRKIVADYDLAHATIHVLCECCVRLSRIANVVEDLDAELLTEDTDDGAES